jgi:DNA-directed RNA polymerase specialized sigma24 family protein
LGANLRSWESGHAETTHQNATPIDKALEALEQVTLRLAQVAQMRYFGGYSWQEIAGTLGISDRTMHHDWENARLILAAALR